MIRVFTARSGAPTATVDGVALHSAYDPEREARRFVSDALAGETPSTVIVLGEGLGHVTDAVRAHSPAARVLSLLYTAEIPPAGPPWGEPSWRPDCGEAPGPWLRARLTDFDVEGLRVIEWPPSARLFPEVSRAANEAVRQVAQELNGSLVTTVGMGRLWIRNTMANLLGLEAPVVGRPCGERRAVVIAASGPSLEEAVRPLRDNRAACDLWALPSSCALLEEAGLSPDLVVMTDPGFYSLYHLWHARLRCPLAMPLSAARGSWALGGPTRRGPYLLAQPSFFETAALRRLGIPVPGVAPHGTVASTAIDLALAATSGPVVLAGLDMSARDIRAHARPNAFDTLLHIEATRVRPHASQLFERAALQRMEPLAGAPDYRVSPALRVYAGWLDEAGAARPGRLFRLHPTPVSLGGMRGIRVGELPGVLNGGDGGPGGALRPVEGYPPRAARRAIALELIDEWTRTVTSGDFPLATDPGLPETAATGLAICATIEPRALLDARRRERRGDAAGAAAARRAMIDGTVAFLARLGDRIRGAA